MKVRITQNCKVKTAGVVQEMKPGKVLDLDFDRADKLIGAGCAALEPFDAGAWIQAIKQMITGFGDQDPREGIWDWVNDERPDLWKDHLAAIRAIDTAFHDGDREAFVFAMRKARNTFDNMVQEWRKGVKK